jgi:hypothetical protein
MPVDAYLQTPPRAVLSYLQTPPRQMNRALRER